MKTLKKSLCLILSVIMVVGVLAVSASAATYPDDDEIEYKEAVEVLTLIGVISGGDDGFAPKATLTREQAAKIITYIVNQKSAESLAKTCAFTDVATGWWSAGYIAYCSAQGIISGYNGQFAPSGTLTGTQWAKMLLCALGYDAEVEGFTGDNWEVNVVSKAEKIGLAEGIEDFNYSANVTREEACQMAFNALGTKMVEYTNPGSNITISGSDTNVSITTGASAATSEGMKTLSDEYFDRVIERAVDDNDGFGRPATKYTYNKKSVIVADEPVATYTNGNQSKFGTKNNYYGYKIDEDVIVTINGVESTWAEVQDLVGVTVEFFGEDEVIDHITVMQSSIAQISNVSAKNDGSITLKIAGVSGTVPIDNDTDDDNDLYDQLLAAGYAKNDYFLVYANETTDDDGDVTVNVLGFTDVDTVEGIVTKVVTSTGKVTIGGSVYQVATNFNNALLKKGVSIDSEILSYETALYINECGYIVAAASEVESGDTLYGVVLAYGAQTPSGSDLISSGDTSIEKIKIFTADGETVIYETVASGITTDDWDDDFIGSDALINKLVSYTLDDDKIDSIEAANGSIGGTTSFTNKGALQLGTKYATSSTLIFITNGTKTAVYTGYASAPSVSGAVTYIDNKAVLITINTEIPGVSTKEQYVIVTDDTISSVYDSNLKKVVYTVDAITPDGTEVTLTWKDTPEGVEKGIFAYTTDDGYVDDFELCADVVTKSNIYKVSASTEDFIVFNGRVIYIDDDTEIFEVSVNSRNYITDSVESDSIPASTEYDTTYVVYVGGEGTSTNPATAIFYVVV